MQGMTSSRTVSIVNSDVFPFLPLTSAAAVDDVLSILVVISWRRTVYDGTKSKQVLKIQYKTLQQTVTDMSLSLAERERAGWSA